MSYTELRKLAAAKVAPESAGQAISATGLVHEVWLKPTSATLDESTIARWASTVHEYLINDVLTDWQTASNGLRFQICRLRHLELDRQARGKRFDLRELSTDDEQRCRTWIKRHPNVCSVFDGHPNIIRNLTAFHDPIENFYWVIDEWIDGEPLQRKLKPGSFNIEQARRLMLDMANGLQSLHEQGIVRRELQPGSILIRNDDGRAVLTEFELAKLIDRGPTVSTAAWPVDAYRAGEADGVDLRADITSWGRISTHASMRILDDASTTTPPRGGPLRAGIGPTFRRIRLLIGP